MNDFLKSIAPALGTALLGPMGGIAAKFIADKIGIDEKTVDAVTEAIGGNKLTADQLAGIKLAEIEFQKFCKTNNVDLEKIAAADRDSARTNNVAGGTQNKLFLLSVLLLGIALGCEVWVLFNGYPVHVPEIVVGRILGLMDSIAAAVLAYWFGTTASSAVKTNLIAQAPAVK
jgi:hypothetical protein